MLNLILQSPFSVNNLMQCWGCLRSLPETPVFPADNVGHTKFPANQNAAGNSAGNLDFVEDFPAELLTYYFNVFFGNSACIPANFTVVLHMEFPADFPAVLFLFLFLFSLNFEFFSFRYWIWSYNFRFKSKLTHIQIKWQIITVDCN